MEPLKSNLTKIIGGIVLVGLLIGAWFIFKPTEKPVSTITTSTELKTGIEKDTTIPGKRDTIYVPYPVPYEKTIYVDRVVSYGKDSSKADTTLSFKEGTITVAATTYPAVEKMKFEIDFLPVLREVFHSDTIKTTRVDTLIQRITETIIQDQPWYNTFLAGAGSVVMIALTVLGLVAL